MPPKKGTRQQPAAADTADYTNAVFFTKQIQLKYLLLFY